MLLVLLFGVVDDDIDCNVLDAEVDVEVDVDVDVEQELHGKRANRRSKILINLLSEMCSQFTMFFWALKRVELNKSMSLESVFFVQCFGSILASLCNS